MDPLLSNELKYYARGTCIASANLFANESILQTFLKLHGVSGQMAGVFTATMNVVQMVVILLFSVKADQVKNVKRTSATFIAFLPAFYLIMLPFTVLKDIPSDVFFGAVMTAGVIQNVFLGLYLILDYKLPYQIINMDRYAQLTSTNGVISSIVLVFLSSATSSMASVFDFNRIMSVMYVFSACCMVAASILTSRLQAVFPQQAPRQDRRTGVGQALRLPAFRVLLAPNLMRGFNRGVIGMAATIGLYELGISAVQSSALAVIFTGMTIVGSAVFMMVSRHVAVHKIYLTGSALMLVSMPLLMAGRCFAVFAAAYVLLIASMTMSDNSVPVIVSQIVPYDCIGAYTSLRLATHTGGVALGSLVAGAVLGRLPIIWLLVFSGAMQFTSGLIYFFFRKKTASVL